MKTWIKNPFPLPGLIAGLSLLLAGRIAAQSPPSVTIQPPNNQVLVTAGDNVCFAVSVAGTGPFSYEWQLNGTNLPNGIITTAAGNGTNGFSGDGGAATNAELNLPIGVAVDATGNLFIADWGNNRIRKVGTNGIINTVAGGGGGYHPEDGGAATNADLYGPSGVAVDTAGNLFIADSETNVIREMGTNGIINTVAGNGFPGYSGDGGAATNAELFYPYGVAVDATGNLFIADSYNQRIRKVVIIIQGPTLCLTNVGVGNAGGYDVVVSSPYGSVTSSVVCLILALPPVVLSAPQITGKTDFTFVLSGPAGSNYVLQVSTNLLNWSSVSTSTIPVSGSITLSNAMSGYNRRFYRAYLQ